MLKGTAVDQAFDRYRVLSILIEWEQDRARANPLDQRYLRLGITQTGDTKPQAARKTEESLDGLAKFVEHVAVLDMVASLEDYFRARITNSIGAIRRLIESDPGSRQFAPKLVKTADDFKGLHDILDLVATMLSGEVIEATKLARESRNNFAHGTDLRVPPKVGPEKTRDNLNEIAARL